MTVVSSSNLQIALGRLAEAACPRCHSQQPFWLETWTAPAPSPAPTGNGRHPMGGPHLLPKNAAELDLLLVIFLARRLWRLRLRLRSRWHRSTRRHLDRRRCFFCCLGGSDLRRGGQPAYGDGGFCSRPLCPALACNRNHAAGLSASGGCGCFKGMDAFSIALTRSVGLPMFGSLRSSTPVPWISILPKSSSRPSRP